MSQTLRKELNIKLNRKMYQTVSLKLQLVPKLHLLFIQHKRLHLDAQLYLVNGTSQKYRSLPKWLPSLAELPSANHTLISRVIV